MSTNLDKQYNNWCLRLYKDTESYDIEEVLQKLIKYDKWCYCLHDKDTWTEEDEKKDPSHVAGTLKKAHYHVVIHSDNAVRGTTVVNWLGIRDVDIEPCKNFKASSLYLIHYREMDKYQYSVADVAANFDFVSFLGAADSAKAFSEIFNFIITNDCKSYRMLCAWAIKEGYYSMVIRGSRIWEKIMFEN